MKRIFPYYTWLRKNSTYQLKQLLEHPERFALVAKVVHGIQNMVDEEDQMDKDYVNDFAQDWVQTPFNTTNEEGRQEPVLWSTNLPYMDIGRIPDPTNPINSLKELFTQTNPLIKVPVEQLINRNVFFDSPIVKEGDSQLNRVDHLLSQHGAYPIIKGAIQKDGADLALHTLNATTGIKALSYDYDKYKSMKIKELVEKEKKKNKKK